MTALIVFASVTVLAVACALWFNRSIRKSRGTSMYKSDVYHRSTRIHPSVWFGGGDSTGGGDCGGAGSSGGQC